ncbi:MAG TPA: c-type cytochrome domain-containing protein, partial [Verrucomicrobiaceae bacterium]
MKHIIPAIFVLVSATQLPAAEAPLNTEQINFFEKFIRPVLANKCYDCHSAKAEKLKGGLRLDTREDTLRGGDNGHAVVPGNLDESLLIKAIRYSDEDMQMPPPKHGGKLSDEVIANFEEWVRLGAPDPRDDSAKKVAVLDRAKAHNFWSFQPPVRSAVPAVKDAAWPKTDIDRHVLAGLESKELKPVEDTDPRGLLRRVYFDLIGIPPSMETADTFAKECAKGPE